MDASPPPTTVTAFNDVTIVRNGKNAVSQENHYAQQSMASQDEQLTSLGGGGIMDNSAKLLQTWRFMNE